MTKKDYVLIADTLAETHRYAKSMKVSTAKMMYYMTVEALVQMFATDNPRFSPARFRSYVAKRAGLPETDV